MRSYHNVFTVNVLWGRKFCSFTFKKDQHIMTRDQVFRPSKVVEKKYFCFFRSYSSILVISRVFKYANIENKFEWFQHKCFSTIGRSSYYEVSIFTSTMNSKSLILFTNWKVSIPLSIRTSLAHCNHWSEQPSTQSEVKCVKYIIDSRCFAGF